jgi:hypothetical protein
MTNLHTGKSLKNYSVSEQLEMRNDIWRFYQNKKTDATVNPAHLLLLPLDQKKIINFLNLSEVGENALEESSAFKKLSTVSKSNSGKLFSPNFFNQSQILKVNTLSLSDNNFFKSSNYNITRQHNLLAPLSLSDNHRIGLDNTSFHRFLVYNSQMLKNEKGVDTHQGLLFFKQKFYSLVEDKMFSLVKQLSFKNSTKVQNLFRDFKNLTNRETVDKFGLNLFDPMLKEFNLLFLNSKLLDITLTKSQNLLNSTGINLRSSFERTPN